VVESKFAWESSNFIEMKYAYVLFAARHRVACLCGRYVHQPVHAPTPSSPTYASFFPRFVASPDLLAWVLQPPSGVTPLALRGT